MSPVIADLLGNASFLHKYISQYFPNHDPIGKTPKRTIFDIHQIKLYKFEGESSQQTPVFILPSVINRYFILDLTPENSLVRFFTDNGYTVYLMDWGHPSNEDRYLPSDYYFLDYLQLCIEKSLTDFGSKDLHFVGHCLGGTIGLTYAARQTGQIRSLSLITTPIDFSKGGLLTKWSRFEGFNIQSLLQAHGNAPWPLLQLAFQMAKPSQWIKKIPTFVERHKDIEFMRNFKAIELWSNDGVSIPGSLFRTLILDLYRKNSLYEGRFNIAGKTIDLKNINCPVYSYAFTQDHIVPVESSFVLQKFLAPDQFKQTESSGGHIGGLISKQAIQSLWPKILLNISQADQQTTTQDRH